MDIQVKVLPTPSSIEDGNIYQYIGPTNDTYTNGFFYTCRNRNSSWGWYLINVQDWIEEKAKSIITNYGQLYLKNFETTPESSWTSLFRDVEKQWVAGHRNIFLIWDKVDKTYELCRVITYNVASDTMALVDHNHTIYSVTRSHHLVKEAQSLRISVMPEASEKELGNVYEFTGESDLFDTEYRYICRFKNGVYYWEKLDQYSPIPPTPSGDRYVSIDPNQGLTSTEKTNAKKNIDLDKVGNFKAVSTVANQSLTQTEITNAWKNIKLDKLSSDKVVAMTGYDKPEETDAITEEDTLNEAIGKLERALDEIQPEHTHTSADIISMSGYLKGDDYSGIMTTDNLNQAIGKLENQIDRKSTVSISGTMVSGNTIGTITIDGNPTDIKVKNSVVSVTESSTDSNSGRIHITYANGTTEDVKVHNINNAAFRDVDDEITEDSEKLITSGAVYDALDGAELTDENVTQTPTVDATDTGEFEVLLAGDTSSTEYTGHTKKSNWLKFSPSTKKLFINSKEVSTEGHAHVSPDVTINDYDKTGHTGDIADDDTLNEALAKLENALDDKAASSHTHAQSDIMMTGYNRGTDSSAVTGSDTLGQAIGKLENRIISGQGSVVSITGTLTSGSKIGTITIDGTSTDLNIQGVSNISEGSTDGTISVSMHGSDQATPVPVHGLDSAAYKNESYFAQAEHDHISPDITIDEYTTTGISGSIADDDTLNEALAKLENAVNSKASSTHVHSGADITTGVISQSVLPSATTSVSGIVQLSSSTGSTSEDMAATPKAVKIAYELAANHTQSSDTVNIDDDYEKPESYSEIDPGDTLTEAIGKLEKALDGVAPLSHSHSSNDVTSMGSYSKLSDSTPVTGSDTLNQAISKLENQIDDKSTVSITGTLTSGASIGTITIDGTSTTLKVPESTDTKVKQQEISGNIEFELLLSKSGTTSTEIDNVNKSSGLTFNPYTSKLKIIGDYRAGTNLEMSDDEIVGKQSDSNKVRLSWDSTFGMLSLGDTDSYGVLRINSRSSEYSVRLLASDEMISPRNIYLPDKNGTIALTSDVPTISVTQTLTSGTEIGSISINGSSTKLYAPNSATSDNDKVKQEQSESNNVNYQVLLSYTNTTSTDNANYSRKSSKLTFNPSTGVLTATKFSGDGSSLTSLNASNLSSGTVPNERLTSASTSTAGIVQLSDAINSTSTELAATASAVKSAYDLANGKSTVSFTQSLTSGTTIGTITIDDTPTDLYCQDTKVTQTDTTAYVSYNILLSYSTDSTTTKTEEAHKTGRLVFNPGASILSIKNQQGKTGNAIISGSGTAIAEGESFITIGNNIAKGTDGNSYGMLRLFGHGLDCIDLLPPDTLTTSRTLYLPNKDGTLAITNDIPSITQVLTSGTKIATVTLGSATTDLYAPAATTYSGSGGITLSGTTFTHSNSVTAVATAGLYKIKYDGQGHITGTSSVAAADLPSHTHSYIPLSGSDSVTGRIKSSASFVSTSSNAFRACNGGYGVIFRNNGSAFNLLLTDKKTDGSEIDGNNWNDLRPFAVTLSNGVVTILKRVLFSTGQMAIKNSNSDDVIIIQDTSNGTAGTTGQAYIMIGNAKPTSSDGNAQGYLRLYDSTGRYANISTNTIPEATPSIQIKLPSTGGTLALTSQIYDASTSRTANTVLAAPNGSAGAASFRKLVASDIPSLSSLYLPITGGTLRGTNTILTIKDDSSSVETRIFDNSFTITDGTDSFAKLYYDESNDTSRLILGNGDSKTKGDIMIYDNNSHFASLSINNNTFTDSHVLYLPDKSGTLAITTDIPSIPSISPVLTSGTKIATVTLGSTSTDLYCQTNTDANVTQTITDSTSANYRILMSSTADNTTRTEGARKSSKLLFNPYNTELFLQGILRVEDANGYICASIYSGTAGTTTSGGKAYVAIGNNKSSTQAGNAQGILRIFDASGQYVDIEAVSGSSRNIYLPNKTGTIATTDDAEKVKQTPSTGNESYEILFSYTADNTTRTEGVRKASSLLFNPSSTTLFMRNSQGNLAGRIVCASGTTTANGKSVIISGNDIESGTAGNSYGALQLYGTGKSYVELVPSTLTAQRTLYLPNKGGTIATTDDVNNVAQTVTTTNANYKVLFSYTADNTSRTEGTRKSNGLTYNPSTKTLTNGKSFWNPEVFTIYDNTNDKSSSMIQIWTRGTTNVIGVAGICVGNAEIGKTDGTGTAGNCRGNIRIYDSSAYYANLQINPGTLTENRNFYLPNFSGELLVRNFNESFSIGAMSSVGWYRIATVSGEGLNVIRGSADLSCDIIIKRTFGNANNEHHEIKLLYLYQTAKFVNEVSFSKSKKITQIRTGFSEEAGFIDIYYDQDANNSSHIILNNTYGTKRWITQTPTKVTDTTFTFYAATNGSTTLYTKKPGSSIAVGDPVYSKYASGKFNRYGDATFKNVTAKTSTTIDVNGTTYTYSGSSETGITRIDAATFAFTE